MSDYDLIVIGAGPGGYVAAIRAAQLGKKVAIIEKDKIGGTCLNRGCIPTKALLHAGNTYASLSHIDTLGVGCQNPTYDMDRIHERKREVVTQLTSGVESLLVANKVDIIYGKAQVTGEREITVASDDGNASYTADDILVAAGSFPARPPIPGLTLPGVVTSDELLEGEPIDYRSLIIIGGGVIGVELATFYASLGCKVTIVEALGRLLANMDKEFGQSQATSLKKRGVDVCCNSTVQSIEQCDEGMRVNFVRKEKEEQVTAQGVLVCIGRKPNTADLFAEGVTPEMNRGFLVVDPDTYRTSIPHIYAIGDAIGGIQLAHKASAEGQAAVSRLYGENPAVDPKFVPSCVYTEPEIASVGMTAEEAKERDIPVKTGKYLMSGNGKSIIDQQERGFIKVVVEENTDKLIGVQMMCGRASDLISEYTMAIANGMTRRELLKGMRPHPSYCEGLTEAHEAVCGESIHSMPVAKR